MDVAEESKAKHGEKSSRPGRFHGQAAEIGRAGAETFPDQNSQGCEWYGEAEKDCCICIGHGRMRDDSSES